MYICDGRTAADDKTWESYLGGLPMLSPLRVGVVEGGILQVCCVRELLKGVRLSIQLLGRASLTVLSVAWALCAGCLAWRQAVICRFMAFASFLMWLFGRAVRPRRRGWTHSRSSSTR